MTEVYVRTSDAGDNIYHTHEDCYRLPDSYRTTTLAAVLPIYDECAVCAGDVPTTGSGCDYSETLTVLDGTLPGGVR